MRSVFATFIVEAGTSQNSGAAQKLSPLTVDKVASKAFSDAITKIVCNNWP